MTTQKDDLVFELQELQTEVEENSRTLDNLCNLLKQNNTKLRTLKQMTNQTPCNHRTPPKYNVEYLDDKMVIVNGIQYQRVEPPKPQTLYDTLYEKGSMYSSVCDTVVKIVTEWLPDDDPHDGEEYQLGWNACLQYLRENMK
jgi:hypothetical protein